MVLSLGLLLVFLSLFLKKTYEDELATLKRESTLLFVNSVHGIQGQMLNKVLFQDVRVKNGGLEQQFTMRLPRKQAGDSLKVLTFVQDRILLTEQGNSQWKETHIPLGEPMAINSDIKGSLSAIVAMGGQDSIKLAIPDSARVLVLLEENFGQAVQNAGLPVQFELLPLKADSSNLKGGFIAGSYTDLASGEQYEAALSGYRPYLLRQMLPQLLFSVLLFACVALAFGFIFRTMRQQQRLAEQKNDFIRNVTHELKTPIATVSVAVEALQNFDALQDPARTREYLDISRLELSRLSLLVDKVLRMSLFEKGEQDLKLEPVDLKSLVEEILGSMKLQFEKQGARVGFQTDGADFSFRGDRMHLASVVYNLLDNALKYSPLKPDIAVDLAQEPGQITLQVRDKGIGIPAAYRDKVFEKFFRVPTGDVHNVKGHGLGLSYVAGVVSQHGGRIELDSAAGEGTCFRILLPAGARSA